LQPGTRIGHYEILTAIGKGGMGEVWKARDTKLRRDVAIKALPSAAAQDTALLVPFEREAALLATLNHPHIATIHGLEQQDGTSVLVLELVEGNTLEDRLRRGAIPVEEALTLALQLAQALEAAHDKDIIHRDLKPSNIKVTPDKRIKVLDFGIAKALATSDNNETMTVNPTREGAIVGTPAYMSPEQARGEAVGFQSDIWSFGAVLYEMLTGISPFRRKTSAETLEACLRRNRTTRRSLRRHPLSRDVSSSAASRRFCRGDCSTCRTCVSSSKKRWRRAPLIIPLCPHRQRDIDSQTNVSLILNWLTELEGRNK
jgi:serine/threonine protein kinase